MKVTEYENTIKLIHEWWNTGTQRKRIDDEKCDRCPHCNQTKSHEHILRCRHDDAQMFRHNQRNTMWKALGRMRMAKIR